MKRQGTLVWALTTALLLSASMALAQGEPTIKVGDKAPPLAGGEWVKGEPVEAFEEGKVYVMEFWATWCGPCIDAIPHVTELQHEYADEGLVIIGQNVWENDESAVEPFVERMGDKMDYRVRMDSPGGSNGVMARTWMQAAGRNGIPCSFIIDQQGTIAWIGHPMSMGPVLEKVIAGNYDPKAEAEREAKVQELVQALTLAAQRGDVDAALQAADEIAEVDPSYASRVALTKFQILSQAGRWDEAYDQASQAIDGIEDANALNQLAWIIVAPDSQLPEKNFEVAMKAAEKANALTEGEEPSILDTLARAHFVQGDKAKAIEFQQKAVDLAEEGPMKQNLQATLESYQAE